MTEIKKKVFKNLSLTISLLFISGCIRQSSNNVEVAGEATPTPIVAAIITPSPKPTGCPAENLKIQSIDPTQISNAKTTAKIADASTVRIEAIPGPNRTDCIGTNGIVLGHIGDTMIIVAAGHNVSGATGAWMIPWNGADRVPARIMAYDTSPDMAVITAKCPDCRKRLKDAKAAKYSPKALSPVQIVGYTYGSVDDLVHPAKISDAKHPFGAAFGETDAYVYTLVIGTANSGDGIWTTNGELLGMAFYEERNPRDIYQNTPAFSRDVFLTAGMLRGIAGKVMTEPQPKTEQTTGPEIQISPTPAPDASNGSLSPNTTQSPTAAATASSPEVTTPAASPSS